MNNIFALILSTDIAQDSSADLEQFGQQTKVIFSFLTELVIIVLVIITIVYVVKVLLGKHHSIRHIHVPRTFEDAGHSGPVIANRIHYRIQQIIQRVSATEYVKGYSTAAAENEVSVDVVGVGLPIKGFIELLGSTLGIQRSKKIDIDFFVERQCLVMLLKISGHPVERFEVPVADSVDLALKSHIAEAAETILKYSNDEILQTYFGLVEQIGEKQIKLAKYRFDLYRDNPKVEVNVIAAWAWGLCMLKRYDEAEEKIKQGIARHKKKAGRIYVIWGSLLTQQGKCEEGLEKLNKALEQVTKNESITRISNIYSSMGNCYSKLGRYDVAMKHMELAVAADVNSSRAYYDMAMLYLAINKVDKFLEVLEKALDKGFQTQNILKDSRALAVMTDPRMSKLMEKFSES